MKLLAIDPGSFKSAFVLMDGEKLIRFGKWPNSDILVVCSNATYESDCIAIEIPRARGMPASNELFVTTMWAGRFIERWWDRRMNGVNFPLSIDRHHVKMHHCNSGRAKDGNIRAAIIDRYGGRSEAIGRKKSPGPLYGVSHDVWQALAIGLLVHDCRHSAEWIREREVRS